MTVKELNNRLRGWDKSEVEIQIIVYDGWGDPHRVSCTIEDVVSEEQGGNFFSAITLCPGDMEEPNTDMNY